ncbi:hypothetical protein SAMN05216349_103180 [Oribacterium sp. KHPX15]|nr:hypothetical protein SAMN05216349_103180 [Oribacterium sp. KHPX15]
MSVNCKLYFVREYDFPDESIEGVSASGIVAMYDIGAFGYDVYQMNFIECFFPDTPFSLLVNKYDDELQVERLKSTITDAYGSRLSYASSNQKLYKCAQKIFKSDPSCRMRYLRDVIKTFKDDENIYIVLYLY